MDIAKLRGVNLGGWLVLERWITPSVFDGTSAQDEHGLLQIPGGKDRIERHRESFIVEDDFKWMAENGVNAVRIPVGYWIFDGDEPFMPCISYLDFAMEMAEKYNLQVLIDLHGAKGSQNGRDHSGQLGKAEWYARPRYRQETIEVLLRLAEQYKDSPALWGIELLNEPKLGIKEVYIVRQFYKEAYQRLTEVVRPGTHIVFSDVFMPRFFSGALKGKVEYPPVMDIHWYQFGWTYVPLYFAQLARRPRAIERFTRRQPVIIGEWSAMLTHRTLSTVPGEKHEALQKEHVLRQLDAYKGAMGWFYWTYKTEGIGVWNFRSLVERGDFSLK